MITVETAKKIIHAIRTGMDTNKDRLIEIDGVVGDGDLGLTMTKAFGAADEQMSGYDQDDVGTFFAQAGMAMAKAAPSTMGTLVATGFMRGGKAVKGKTDLTGEDVAVFFRAFSDGIMERGKTKLGNKTIVDVTDPVAAALESAVAENADATTLASVATDAAHSGEIAAREMVSQHGKAAIYREQTKGKPDPGATAGVIVVEGFFTALTDLV